MSRAASYAWGAVIGYAADAALGDPRRGHPVAAFGLVAGRLEKALWRDHRGVGSLYTAVCVGAVAATAVAAERLAGGAGTAPRGRGADGGRAAHRGRAAAAGRVLTTAAATWTVLGGTSLTREARAIGGALHSGDLTTARERLPHLCGRDPSTLDEQQIARAVVESVAENTADAVVNALVWGALAGTPGLLAFRAVNTLDAMVGHRSPRHRRFGWASARLDDVAGWPGARLTALLTVAAAPSPGTAWRTWRRDGRAHPSPNAGQAESAFAGALGVRLGGTLRYGLGARARVEHRPVLGAELRPVTADDIERACVLSRRVGLLALGVTVAARYAVTAAAAATSAAAMSAAAMRGRRI